MKAQNRLMKGTEEANQRSVRSIDLARGKGHNQPQAGRTQEEGGGTWVTW